MVIWELIQQFGGWLFGGGGIIYGIVYWRKNSRLKSAEVVSAEVAACKESIAMQAERITSLHEEVKLLQERLNNAHVTIGTQYQSISLLELKNSQKKSIIAQAHGCGSTPIAGCPVLLRQQQIEDEYRQKLEKRAL